MQSESFNQVHSTKKNEFQEDMTHPLSAVMPLIITNKVQYCLIENQQSPIYVLRRPDGCLEYCHNLALLTHCDHI